MTDSIGRKNHESHNPPSKIWKNLNILPNLRNNRFTFGLIISLTLLNSGCWFDFFWKSTKQDVATERKIEQSSVNFLHFYKRITILDEQVQNNIGNNGFISIIKISQDYIVWKKNNLVSATFYEQEKELDKIISDIESSFVTFLNKYVNYLDAMYSIINENGNFPNDMPGEIGRFVNFYKQLLVFRKYLQITNESDIALVKSIAEKAIIKYDIH